MRVDVTGRHVEITSPLRLLLEQRLAKLERLLNDNAISAHVILTKEKYRHRTEIVVHARGDHVMRGLGEGNAWPISMRQAAEKLEQQAQTLKGKWTEGKRVATRRKSPRAAGEPRASEGGRVRRILDDDDWDYSYRGQRLRDVVHEPVLPVDGAPNASQRPCRYIAPSARSCRP